MKVIIATTSPYRKKVFSYLDIPFEAEASNVDPVLVLRSNPKKLVLELAKRKAEAVAQRHGDAIIVGFDSVGYFKGNILEKPKDKKQAYLRLRNLSGKRHRMYTAVYAINTLTDKRAFEIVRTDVWFRKLSDNEIREYVKSDHNLMTYCLGYDPEQGVSATFIKKISGSCQNLLNGMPVEVIPKLLAKLDY